MIYVIYTTTKKIWEILLSHCPVTIETIPLAVACPPFLASVIGTKIGPIPIKLAKPNRKANKLVPIRPASNPRIDTTRVHLRRDCGKDSYICNAVASTQLSRRKIAEVVRYICRDSSRANHCQRRNLHLSRWATYRAAVGTAAYLRNFVVRNQQLGDAVSLSNRVTKQRAVASTTRIRRMRYLLLAERCRRRLCAFRSYVSCVTASYS